MCLKKLIWGNSCVLVSDFDQILFCQYISIKIWLDDFTLLEPCFNVSCDFLTVLIVAADKFCVVNLQTPHNEQ